MDPRIKWIGDRTLALLGEENFGLFDEMLDADEGALRKQMLDFFFNNSSTISEITREKAMFCVRRIYYDRIVEVEKEITESRIVFPPVVDNIEPAMPKPKIKKKNIKKRTVSPALKVKVTVKNVKKKTPRKNNESKLNTEGTDQKEGKAQNEADTFKEDKNEGNVKTFDDVLANENHDTLVAEGNIEYYTVKCFVPLTLKVSKFEGSFGSITPDDTNPDIKYVYFLKTLESPIPTQSDDLSAKRNLSKYFVVGSFKGNIQKSLLSILKQVYMPLFKGVTEMSSLVNDNLAEAESASYTKPSLFHRMATKHHSENSLDGIKSKLLQNSKMLKSFEERPKLIEQITYVTHKCSGIGNNLTQLINHLESLGDSTIKESKLTPLKLPELYDERFSIEDLCANEKVVNFAENSATAWFSTISSYLEPRIFKNMTIEGFFKETEFWGKQHLETQAIFEELFLPSNQKILNILKLMNSDLYMHLIDNIQKLNIHSKLSLENTKILSSLMKYLEIVVDCSDTKTIDDKMLGLINELKMLWTQSIFYHAEDHFIEFLERMVNALCEKIEENLALETIFDKPLNEVHVYAKNASEILKKWSIYYVVTKQKINAQGKRKRWDFDDRKLSDQTDYSVDICEELAKVAQTLFEFENVLVSDVKILPTSKIEIEDLNKDLKELILPIKTIDFSIFHPDNKHRWDFIMDDFKRVACLFENKSNQFIDKTFTTPRSSEEAFNILMKLTKTQLRPSAHLIVLNKFDCIWDQFFKEISSAHMTFNLLQDNPPLPKNHPPVSGAISWSRTLRKKISDPCLKFKNSDEMDRCNNKFETLDSYDEFISALKKYENDKFNCWLSFKQPAIKHILNSPLLKLKPTKLNPAEPLPKPSSISMLNPKVSRNSKKPSMAKKRSLASEPVKCLFSQSGLRLVVNFDSNYFNVIDEIGVLESLGFKFPNKFYHHAKHADNFKKETDKLEDVVSKYNDLLIGIAPHEIKLLYDSLYEFESSLSPCLDRITWLSLSFESFIAKCQKELELLLDKHNIATVIRSKLENLLTQLEASNLFLLHDMEIGEKTKKYTGLPLMLFIANLEKLRSREFESMLKLYENIGETLMKLEFHTMGTKTGKSNTMRDIYKFWDSEILKTLIEVSTRSLIALHDALNYGKPLFQVDAVLRPSGVVISPTPKEVRNILRQNLNDLMDRFKLFPRWQEDSCLSSTTESYHSITFHDEISSDERIKSISSLIVSTAERVIQDADQCIKKLTKYSILWSYNIQSSCEHYIITQKPNEVAKFDESFMFYEEIIQELDDHVKFYDIGSIQINLEPAVSQIRNYAVNWMKTLGECLIREGKQKMDKLSQIINRLTIDLTRYTERMSDFMLVMMATDQVKTLTSGAEVFYKSIYELFQMLKSHRIELREADLEQSWNLQNDWHELYLTCIYRLDTIAKPRNKFSKETFERGIELSTLTKRFADGFYKNGPGVCSDNLDKGLSLIKDCMNAFENFETQIRILRSHEEFFTNPPADFSEFTKSKSDFNNLQLIFKIYEKMIQERENHARVFWADLDVSTLATSEESIREEFRKLPKLTRQMPCGESLKSKMDEFRNIIPSMQLLKNDAIKDRHWNDLMTKIGVTFDVHAHDFTLGVMFDLKLDQHQSVVEDVVSCAIKEASIENDLQTIEQTWTNLKFEVVQHFKDGVDRGYLLNSLDDVMTLLDDNYVNLQKIMVSRFVGPFLPRVKEWAKKLSITTEVLDQWLTTQHKWLYLESIFIGTELRDKLPKETEKFDKIDHVFVEIMKDTAERLLIMECCLVVGLKQKFVVICEELEECQKVIIDYIDSKRKIFPRFYFLSTDELLSIFGNTDPNCVQEHINKMFDNLNAIKLVKDTVSGKTEVAGLVSNENEVLNFRNNVKVSDNVEDWMKLTVSEMKSSLRFCAKKAIYDYGKGMHKDRITWILQNHGTVGLVANIMWWTIETEHMFDKMSKDCPNAMKDFLNRLDEKLKTLVYKVREELPPNEYKKLKAIITIEVHMKDIIESFVMKHVVSKEQFEWESQLRTYWIKELDDIQIQQCAGLFDYGHEYMGLNGRLIITPLTDRIYLTITQALTLHLGTAPAGPAGTGKTETVKDLAKALGLLCMVTNCGENLNYKMVGQIFAGLCACGAWGCFDEFNRIDISVLSVVSTQLHSIRNALMMKQTEFMFGGTLTQIDPKVGVFVTMNPGYEGRTELPQSLKVFFRPVMCIVPDYEIICQISLYSDGFLKAKVLAKKITVLYKMASDQLSKQSHYDWGLRALVALLRMSAFLKRKSPLEEEESILMMALRNINQPKLLAEDSNLFLNLIRDLFHGLDYPDDADTSLIEKIQVVISEQNLTSVPGQIEKVIQLEKTLVTQYSVMLVGPSGGGKTTIISLYIGLMTHIGKSAKLTTLNPKAVTVNELYGVQNIITRDWTDGLFSSIFRKANSHINKDTSQFILFDGDVDALWIENINSVMDDNKLLTLANGERIRLMPNCFLLFEVGNLNHASPATISRAGMLYVGTQEFNHEHYWKNWISSRRNDGELLQTLYDTFVPKVVSYVFYEASDSQNGKALNLVIPQSPLNSVIQFCYILDALIPVKSDDQNYENNVIQCCFIMGLYYSFGSILLKENHVNFDSFVKKRCTLLPVDDTPENKAALDCLPRTFPTLFDYHVNIEENCWEAWEWVMPKYIHNAAVDFCDILVPTMDTLRITWFLGLMRKVQRPLLLTGDVGTSKTAIIMHHLKNLNHEENVTLKYNFSSKTTSADIKNILKARMEKRSKGIYGPPIGKSMTVFIDDISLPEVDKYGTQKPIAFLKLLLEKNGFYDQEIQFKWKMLVDTFVLAAMVKSGDGKNDMEQRFTSKFSIINLTSPTDEVMKHIYLSILSGHMQTFSEAARGVTEKLINMTLDLYKIAKEEFLPTPSKFHYIFNLRDVSRVACGLCSTHSSMYPEPKHIMRVWRNEFIRVFCDRMVTLEDQNYMQDRIASIVTKSFRPVSQRGSVLSQRSERFRNSIASRMSIRIDEEAIKKSYEFEKYVLRDPVMFGDFRNALGEEACFYEDLSDYDLVHDLFREILEDYNDVVRNMSMVLFENCLEHMIRIHRVLRTERSHMMIVGPGSSGKKSMLTLAAYAAGASIFEILTVHGYDESSFRDDLKRLYEMLGVNRKKIVFFISASQMNDDCFLDLINDMLINGTVSTLFNQEEKEKLNYSIWDYAIECGTLPEKESVWEFFEKTCAKHLNIVLTSPPGDALRKKCSRFPGLINNTTVDWIFSWPKQALLAVAKNFMDDVPNLPQNHKELIIDHVVYVHESAIKYTTDYKLQMKRHNHITPHHFINFITQFLKILIDKDKTMSLKCKTLEDGVLKIEEANTQILELKNQLTQQEKVLSVQNEECSIIQEKVLKARNMTNAKKNDVLNKSIELEEQNKLLLVNKKAAEDALFAAMPALNSARAAIDKLSKGDITELRSFAFPHENVQTVCETILILRGEKEITWENARKVMSDTNFLKTLLNTNFDIITPSQIKAADVHLKKIKVPEHVESQSKAAFGLLQYVNSVKKYCIVFKDVKPKKLKVESLEREYNKAKNELDELNADIIRMTAELDDLNIKYEETLKKENEIKLSTDHLMKRVTTAEKLILGLSSENKRWSEELTSIQIEKSEFVGNCLLSSAFLNYTAPFTFEYRHQMVYVDWMNDIQQRNIPIYMPFKIEKSLTNDVETSKWNSNGLPPDEFSIQNGILTTQSDSFPLCIDPQEQAFNWIKNMEGNNSLKIITLNDSAYVKQLEMAIKFGHSVIIQDVPEEINPILYHLFEKNIKIELGRQYIKLGSAEVDYDPNFRLYLTTKISNPKLDPTVFTKLVIINCIVTLPCLEEQLLRIVIHNEKPELESQRELVIRDNFESKMLLQQLEKDLLHELSTATGNLLDNEDLVNVLEITKEKVSEITEKIALGLKTTTEINFMRDIYRSVAERGAILYFTLLDMSCVNYMYQYCLDAYFDVFLASLKKITNESDLENKLRAIIDQLTYDTYEYCCAGIFEEHKLLLSFQISINLQKKMGEITQEQVDFFAKGSLTIDDTKTTSKLSWLSNEKWEMIEYISKKFINSFDNLPTDVLQNEEVWKQWCNHDKPEEIKLPGGYEEKLAPFDKLLLLRCFRADRVRAGVRKYVIDALGNEYSTPPPFQLEKIFETTTAFSFVIFILTAGSDPMRYITQLADSFGFLENKLKYLSLGQGQEKIALDLLSTSMINGEWIVLQNCHLLTDFLKDLEKALENISDPDPEFRLWLTTEPTLSFPIGLLQRGINVITEPPVGLKENLKNIYLKLDNDQLEECNHHKFKKIIYSLAFFHAIVQERRKYDKIGWNICYDFNDTDFNICLEILKHYLEKLDSNKSVPWDTLKFLFGEIMYGARVIDNYDRRTLNTYIEEYFGDFLFDKYQPFYFFNDDNFKLGLPPDGQKQEYIEYIENLPSLNSPEILGLHSNSEIEYYIKSFKKICDYIIEMQPKTSGASLATTSKEDIVSNLSKEILDKIPPNFNVNKTKGKIIKEFGEISPVSAVLLQELERFNQLSEAMAKTLKVLQKALIGEIEMSTNMENISNSLYDGRLPDEWIKLTPQTCKSLGNWMMQFVERSAQYEFWSTREEPYVMWLSGLHVPESFLMAHMQTTSRLRSLPLEEVTLFTDVTLHADHAVIEDMPEDGCYIRGLYLEGAMWNREEKRLQRSHPNILVTELPVLHMVPAKITFTISHNILPTPVYTTSNRRNAAGKGFVFELQLKKIEHASIWILQGVCSIMNTD